MGTMNNTPRPAQSGSAFFIILFGIFLFGALSFAVMQGGRMSEGSMSQQQARLAAEEILNSAESVRAGVQKLRLSGCDIGQLGFEKGSGLYVNPSSPADGSCNVWQGGKANAQADTIQPNWLDGTKSGSAAYGVWIITSGSCVPHIGTGGASCNSVAEAEILTILPWLKKDVCAAINNILTGSSTIPKDIGSAYNPASLFKGSFTAPQTINNSDNDMVSKSQLCFEGDTAPSGGYHFYSVVLAR